MKKRTIYIILAAAAVMSTFAYFLFFRGNKAQVNWTTTKADRGDISITVTATGSISAVTTVQVGTQVSGTISRLFADFNSNVKENQVIALLDTTYLAAAVEDASAATYRARVQMEQNRKELDRTISLLNVKSAAQADYDLAYSTYQASVGAYRSAMAQLNRARINLRYATIKAPISGVVISRSVDVGQTVAASFATPTLFTIANDLTKMQVQASVDEADIGEVKLGQKVSFTVDAYPSKEFIGTVQQIRLQPVTVQNVVNYIVIIDVPNPDKELMPGMTANITIHVAEHRNILRVPVKAFKFNPPAQYFALWESQAPDSARPRIRQMAQEAKSLYGFSANNPEYYMQQPGSKQRIWVKSSKGVRPVIVTLGLNDGNMAEVSGNLRQGEEVITEAEMTGKASSTSSSPFMPQFRNQRKKS